MRSDVLPGCRAASERHRRKMHESGEPPTFVSKEPEAPRTGCVEREEDTSLDRPDEITSRRSRCP